MPIRSRCGSLWTTRALCLLLLLSCSGGSEPSEPGLGRENAENGGMSALRWGMNALGRPIDAVSRGMTRRPVMPHSSPPSKAAGSV